MAPEKHNRVRQDLRLICPISFVIEKSKTFERKRRKVTGLREKSYDSGTANYSMVAKI